MARARSFLVLTSLLGAAVPAFGSAHEHCLSPQAGRQLLESGQILPFPDALDRSGIAPEQVQNVDLCPSNGSYVYEVHLNEPAGPARKPISAEPEPEAR